MKNIKEGLVYIAPSKIANSGNGVFVSSDVKKGTPLMYYHGYVVNSEKLDRERHCYALQGPLGIVVGYKEPKNNRGVAQICNDYACPVIDEKISSLDFEKRFRVCLDIFQDYWNKSTEGENVTVDGLIFYALRDMKKDDECYFTYSVPYWICSCAYRTKNIKIKSVLCFLENIIHRELKYNYDFSIIFSRISKIPIEKFFPREIRKLNLSRETMINVMEEHIENSIKNSEDEICQVLWDY